MQLRRSIVVAPLVLCCALGAAAAHAQPALGADNDLPSEGGPTTSENDIVFPDYYDGIGDSGLAIVTAMEAFPDVYGGLRFDQQSVSHVVKLYSWGADPDRVHAAAAALESIPLTHDIRIQTEESTFALAEREGLVATIAEDIAGWSARLGSDIVTVHVDDGSGEVVIGVDNPSAATAPASFVENDVPIVITEASFEPHAGTRRDDRGYWTAGNWMATSGRASTGPADCTQGFTWRRWGISGAWGGIAKHCVTRSGVTQWWHNGRRLGDYAIGHPSYDGALLRGEPVTSFSPTVWVGGASTNVERTVVGAMPLPEVGVNTALSGANLGLTMFSIVDDSVFVTGYGFLVTTDGDECVGGDSGGPWLNTQSGTGNVIAHGQHAGEAQISGTIHCAYLPVNRLSAMLEASILTG